MIGAVEEDVMLLAFKEKVRYMFHLTMKNADLCKVPGSNTEPPNCSQPYPSSFVQNIFLSLTFIFQVHNVVYQQRTMRIFKHTNPVLHIPRELNLGLVWLVEVQGVDVQLKVVNI